MGIERNKSKWYIRRCITDTGFSAEPITKTVYEVRDDKEPEEVEVGDSVVISLKMSGGTDDQVVGQVIKIGLYDDGLYRISVYSPRYDDSFLTTPNRIGILRKGVKKDGK